MRSLLQTIERRRVGTAIGRRDHLTFRGNVAQGRHSWLRLTPAYSLHVVRELLEAHSDNGFVLDPFSGTGTTPLVAAQLGIPSHGVDINPFLVWLSNLKATMFAEDTSGTLRDEARTIVQKLQRRTDSRRAWKPELHAIEKWWGIPTLQAVAELYDTITKHHSSPIGDLLKVGFCRVLIATANVSFGHQSMSFKKNVDEKTHPKLLDDPQQISSRRRVLSEFLAAADEVARSLETDIPKAPSTTFLGDARRLDDTLPQKYTTVITSPPYPNRMSYIRELRPYMYWLGYLTNGRQAGELDWEAIGGTWGSATSLLNTWNVKEGAQIPFHEFDRIVTKIAERSPVLGRYVNKYFHDIKEHIVSLSKVLRPGAQCYYIVGNSKFYDIVLPVEEIYAALFNDGGFVNVSVETLRKRTSKKELYEFVVSATLPRNKAP